MTRCLVVSPHHPAELVESDLPPLPVPSTWGGSLVYVRLPATFEIEYLDHELDRILGRHVEEADPVIIRCHKSISAAILSSDVVRGRLRTRFPSSAVLLLRVSPSTHVHELLALGDDELELPAPQDLLPLLRAIDLQVGLDEPGATLPANPEFHYEGPNGRHYAKFIRASYAFQSVDSMEGIGFWLLPYFLKVQVLVLDSWTMLGLGHTIANYAVREIPARMPTQPVVVCSEEYGEQDTFEQRLSVAVAGLGDSPKAMIITSVHSTGATEDRLLAAAGSASLRVSKVIRVYANAEKPKAHRSEVVVTLHVLEEQIVSSRPGTCADCLTNRKSVVPVDKRSLLLSLTAAVQEARITRPMVGETREFIERYSDVSAISVHRSTADGQAHHMVYVDVEQLLRSDSFRRRAAEKAADFAGRVQVVLSATHPAAQGLAKFVAEELGVHHVACEQGAYSSLEGHDKAALFAAEGILFVDDVAITGTRIRRVKSSLMQSRVITDRRDVDIMMLVGVARPALERAWSGVVDMVGATNLRWVDKIVLPAWGPDACPWCLELRELEHFHDHEATSDYLSERIDRLRDVNAGLREDLFLVTGRDAGGTLKSLSARGMDAGEFATEQVTIPTRYQVTRTYSFTDLGQNSIFGKLNEVELFVAVASALQRLRDSGDLSERSQYPLSRVLDPYLYFLGRFYANLIVACILRSARRRDLRTVDIEPLLRKAAGDRLLEDESRELRIELLNAMTQGKLPWPEEASNPTAYSSLDDSVRAFAWWLLDGRSEP